MATTAAIGGGVLCSRVHARIGLLGNPSDGFNGKCISLSLQNFYAEVTLVPTAKLQFLPNLESDPQEFDGLEGLVQHVRGCGYYGGIRLLKAMCKRFWEYCQDHAIELPPASNFSLSYNTTIPRQCGLSGSSAIACAALNCLLQHYGLESAVPLVDRPALVLSAEAELGITAGLQDRVIQVYGGLVYMDFNAQYMQQHGHGQYESLDPALLPPLWLIYNATAASGKDSGRVHSDVKQRWLAGDTGVRLLMQELASLAELGRRALHQRDYDTLTQLMQRNWQLRRQLYGDEVVGGGSRALVEAAGSVGAAAKLTGSGGAAVSFCPKGEQQAAQLQQACQLRGLTCVPVQVAPALYTATCTA